MSGIAARARTALARRYGELHSGGATPDTKGYIAFPDANLIEGIAPSDFTDDLRQGDGSELEARDGNAPKFCAVHSSAALAVNAFAPFRRFPERLLFPGGHTGFDFARFEHKLPTGLRGNPPNLDFFASGSSTIVAVESKCTEIFSPKKAEFRDAYGPLVAKVADAPWRGVYELLKSGPEHYTMLDAAQLMKHYLGLVKNANPGDRQVVLLYVYWTPLNHAELAEYRRHEQEVGDFADRVKGSRVKFAAMNYNDLWDFWCQRCNWSGITVHVRRLRERYAIDI